MLASPDATAPGLTPPVLLAGPLEIRPAEFQVLAGGKRANLTVREFEVFLALAEQRDCVVTREEVYRARGRIVAATEAAA